MRRFTSVALLVLLAGCGVIEGDSQASKKQNNANPIPNNSPDPLNNPDIDDLWAQFGTRGSVDNQTKSPDGNALCGLADIRTDDIGQTADNTIPAGKWDVVVDDQPGRCGDDFETTAWRLMNCERISRDAAPYFCDQRLVWLGRQHSQDMITLNYFDHIDRAGNSPFDRMGARGIGFSGAAENLAINPSAEGAHHAWMDSSGHRNNILGNYDYAGCGAVDSYYTTGFIR